MWSPGGELVSGLGRMEKVPEGSKHLWSYRHAGEINIKNTEPAQLWVGFPVLVCGLGARRPPKDRPCVALSAAALTPQTGLQSQSSLAVCGSAEGDLSPNNTQNVEGPPTGIFLSLDFFPPFIRLTYPPPCASGCLKKHFGSSAFDLFSMLNSPVVYSPTSFYIWQRDSTIFIFSSTLAFLLLWWAVDMCHVLKPKRLLAHEVWSSFFFFFSVMSVIQFQTVKDKKIDWIKRAKDRRAERLPTL